MFPIIVYGLFLFPVSRGCSLPLVTWFYLYLFWGPCCSALNMYFVLWMFEMVEVCHFFIYSMSAWGLQWYTRGRLLGRLFALDCKADQSFFLPPVSKPLDIPNTNGLYSVDLRVCFWNIYVLGHSWLAWGLLGSTLVLLFQSRRRPWVDT